MVGDGDSKAVGGRRVGGGIKTPAKPNSVAPCVLICRPRGVGWLDHLFFFNICERENTERNGSKSLFLFPF